MKHEDKSDKEINIELNLALLWKQYPNAKSIEHDSQQNCFLVELVWFYPREVIDYCNSWADIGPLIEWHGIQLYKLQPNNDAWIARGYVKDGAISFKRFASADDSPTRAAAVCLLYALEGE